jgi:hypothetical protein
MRFKKKELLLSLMVGTGLHLLNYLRERLPDNADDIKDRLRDTYDTASDRVSRATNALRGEEDSQILGKVGALLIDKVRQRTEKKPQGATGTHGA